MGTFVAKKEEIDREWLVVDAADKPLGRVASEVAKILRGKHKPTFTPHVDTGDQVIVVNAAKIKLTGKKGTDKVQYRHSGYIGSLRAIPYSRLMGEKPEEVMRLAVKGMLPRNKLGRQMIKKLRVYAGPDHPHQAQNPRSVEVAG